MINGVTDQGLFHHFFPSDLVHHILIRVKNYMSLKSHSCQLLHDDSENISKN